MYTKCNQLNENMNTHTDIRFENAIIAFEMLKELSCLMAQNLKMERSAVSILKIHTYVYKFNSQRGFFMPSHIEYESKKNEERIKKSNCFLTTLSHSLI